MKHLHLLWLVPMVAALSLGVSAYFNRPDEIAESLATQAALGMIFGWWGRSFWTDD